MPDTYTIYLVNQSASEQLFWCFLARPEELVSDPDVFANSSASLAVDPNSPGQNYFGIPVQYILGAGASNNAVGLNIQVVSNVTNDADLKDIWEADYATVPPQKGPSMTQNGTGSPDNTLTIVSNDFDQVKNQNASWFSNQSFGIQTQAGFIGMSWSPAPSQKRVITPKLTFYVSAGTFDSNNLASWNQVSVDSAIIKAPSDFKFLKSTVTYSSRGKWSVTKGPPAPQTLRSEAHNELVALSHLGQGKVFDTIKKVSWHSHAFMFEEGDTYLSGTITVTQAVVGAFTFFVIAGITFSIVGRVGNFDIDFEYSGPLTVKAVQDIVTAGAKLFLG
jgi:hypothetical protein